MKHIIRFLVICHLLLFLHCDNKSTHKLGLIAENAMVVSAREEASKIGVDIMKKGGNAFDSMMATEFALAVVHPSAGNLGGGGFMVYRLANGQTGAIDYREKAPLGATKNMYLDSLGIVVNEKSTIGAMAIGVPGTVAGVFKAHKNTGSLVWRKFFLRSSHWPETDSRSPKNNRNGLADTMAYLHVSMANPLDTIQRPDRVIP
jgi:gamma-glutamyltranspeptidase/glutathione hydrolase